MGEYGVGKITRERILTECRTLFYHKGLRGTSYDDICEKAGINRGLISYYFKSKNNVALQIFEELIEAVREEVSPCCVSCTFTEKFIIEELFLYELLMSDKNVCSFYAEIERKNAFSPTTRKMQYTLLRTLASDNNIEIDQSSFQTIVCMAEGAETELIKGMLEDYLLEPYYKIVERDVAFVFDLLGISRDILNCAMDKALAQKGGYRIVCADSFEPVLEKII